MMTDNCPCCSRLARRVGFLSLRDRYLPSVPVLHYALPVT
jgi:hypothetical protein